MDLAIELLALIAEDDATRNRLAHDGELFRHGHHPEMAAVQRANVRRLAALVAAYGWPGHGKVGKDAAAAAWRILQHAIGEPALMRALAPHLYAAAARGDADPAHAAMLEDRIAVCEGRPQRYGTQSDWDEALTAMVPSIGVLEPEHVDARRAKVGLPPLVWRRPVPEDQLAHAPQNWHARQAEIEAWARAVGWRNGSTNSADIDLAACLELDDEQFGALEQFLGRCLFAAGAWRSPRQSDGITTLRVVERTPHRVQLCGAIYADVATQKLSTFWLDLTITTVPSVNWMIHLDPIEERDADHSELKARQALWLLGTASDTAWRVSARGTATVTAGRLHVDAGEA